MKFNQKMVMSLAVIAVVMSVMSMGTNGQEKLDTCCTSVSTANITSPITGFSIQLKPNPPCVRAVIFYTDEGMKCMYRKLPWVKQKVMELIKQNLNMMMNSTVSTPLSTTSF